MARTKQTARKSTGGKASTRHLVDKYGSASASSLAPISISDTASSGVDASVDHGIKKDLGRLLSTAFKSQRDGSYAGSGTLKDAPNPCINVDGYGPLGLPLGDSEATRLADVCALAPYGKGVETVVDTAVRRTWQIDSSRVQFDNPGWSEYLQNNVLAHVSAELGVKKSATTARLYKLLLYSEGGHFERHQDTEKEANMFGTLVIVLPSRFAGGEVVVTHRGQEKAFDLASNSEFATSFTCLYTDVYHSVKPVTSGHRLALVYNLVHTAPATALPRPFSITLEMDTLRNTLELWSTRVRTGSQADAPVFVAHLLEQNYSKFGLRFNLLKGRDEVKVGYLRTLADQLGFSIYLAQLKIDTHGYADHEGYDSDESEAFYNLGVTKTGKDKTAPGMVEETDPPNYLLGPSAIGSDGSGLDLSRIDVVQDLLPNLVPKLDLTKLEPDEWEDEGYLGNGAGALDHHYHRTLLLLWPKENDSAMTVLGAGEARLIRDLKRRISSLQDSDEPTTEDRAAVAALATTLSSCSGDKATVQVARAAIALGDTEMFLKAIAGKSLLTMDATVWVGAIMALGFEGIRTRLDEALSYPLIEAGIREKAVQHIAKAFPRNEEIQSWASNQDPHVSDKLVLDKSQVREPAPSDETSIAKENDSNRTEAHVGVAKRPVGEIIDLTDSPERAPKRRA